MPDLAPVVCALDLDPASEPALVAAAELAARTDEPLHLVTVRPPEGPEVSRAPSDPEADVRAVVEIYVDRALGAGACAELAPQIAVVRDARPAEAVLEYAAEVGAGSLVLGTHARRGLERLRLGSIATETIRRAPCPVLVVPNRTAVRTPGPDHPVLVPVDFSEHSARALEVSAAFARLYGAPIETLYVSDPVSEAALTTTIGRGPSDGPIGEDDLRAFALEAGCDRAGARVVGGDPADAVVRLAKALGAGAVVMGTHGHRGIAHVLLGSVTEAALRRLPCPVLAVRARGA